MVSLALLLNHDEPDVNRSHLRLWLVCSAASLFGSKAKQTTIETPRLVSSAIALEKKNNKSV